jgi:hypothetical protein
VICVLIPPRSPASPAGAAGDPADGSADAGDAGENAAPSMADGAELRLGGRAARSSGAPNPSRVRWTDLTGVAPMLPTDRATVGLLPSVGAAAFAGLAAVAAGVAGGAAGPAAAVEDGNEDDWAEAEDEASRWTRAATWRCATAGSGVSAAAGAPAVLGDAVSAPPLRIGAPRPARRD